jgi:DNA repair protein RadC
MVKVVTLDEAKVAPRWIRIVRDARHPRVITLTQMTGPRTVAEWVAKEVIAEQVEVFVLLLLDIQMQVIGAVEVSRGGINSTIVDPRAIFQAAFLMMAAHIVTVHNHPSGIVTPSTDDRMVWGQLNTAGKFLGITVVDHMIIGSDPITGTTRYFSAAESGLL